MLQGTPVALSITPRLMLRTPVDPREHAMAAKNGERSSSSPATPTQSWPRRSPPLPRDPLAAAVVRRFADMEIFVEIRRTPRRGPASAVSLSNRPRSAPRQSTSSLSWKAIRAIEIERAPCRHPRERQQLQVAQAFGAGAGSVAVELRS